MKILGTVNVSKCGKQLEFDEESWRQLVILLRETTGIKSKKKRIIKKKIKDIIHIGLKLYVERMQNEK